MAERTNQGCFSNPEPTEGPTERPPGPKTTVENKKIKRYIAFDYEIRKTLRQMKNEIKELRRIITGDK